MTVTRRTGALCTDEINVQFLQDVSDAVQTTEAELLVMEADQVDNDLDLDLEQRIAKLDRLVEKAQVLLRRAGFECEWGSASYTISHVDRS